MREKCFLIFHEVTTRDDDSRSLYTTEKIWIETFSGFSMIFLIYSTDMDTTSMFSFSLVVDDDTIYLGIEPLELDNASTMTLTQRDNASIFAIGAECIMPISMLIAE